MEQGLAMVVGMTIAYAASFLGMALAYLGWRKRHGEGGGGDGDGGRSGGGGRSRGGGRSGGGERLGSGKRPGDGEWSGGGEHSGERAR